MLVKQARDIARQWVMEHSGAIPGFDGAFYHGSINWLPDDAVFPAGSDVDVMIVVTGPVPEKLGKLVYRDVLLEISYMPSDQLQSPQQVLGVSFLAGSFRQPSVILDPTGQLTKLNAAVAQDYARRHWVRKRCEFARDKVLKNLESLREAKPFHDQVSAWLFAAGVTTHILLSAGLKNPTVRRRYVATKALLAEYDKSESYEGLLDMLGCTHMSRAQVERHLVGLVRVFDTAAAVLKTPFAFAADISAVGRPIAIDGSWELIERGYHREAVFWLVATYSRCMSVLYCDAPAGVYERFAPGYRRLLSELGVRLFADLAKRRGEITDSLQGIMALAEDIMAANPEIMD